MHVKEYWRVAQQVERLAVNQGVVGPSPTVPADVPDLCRRHIKKINRRIKSNEKNKTKTEGEMPKTEYQFASVAKRYGSGLLTRISRVRITSGAFRVNPGNRLYSLVW